MSKKIISYILSIIMVFSCITVNTNFKAYANIEKSYVDKIISNTKKPYDILVRLKSDNSSSLSLKEKASLSQRELLELFKEQGVEEYESFYISNAVHVIIENEALLRKIGALESVDRITLNNKINLIEPIEEKNRSIIYSPDSKNIEWGVKSIHADKVWEEFGIEGEGVTVGIIDTGVNYNLPAIKSAYKGYDEATGNIDKSFYKDFIDGLDAPVADSKNSHGTHVAGIICGREGENLNQIGVAPKVKFISARALDDKGGDIANLMAAAEWMLEQAPDIINNSWGGTSDDDIWFKDIAKAWKDAGIIAVFASGNRNPGEEKPGYGSIANPANLLDVLSVGAVDIDRKIGDFSKKGPSAFDETKSIIKPELVAPGVQVRSIDAMGNYVSWNGTSMAAPHVTGVLALMKSLKPDIGVEEAVDILKNTALPLKDKEFDKTPNMAYGYGMVDAYDAIALLKGRNTGSISGRVLKEGADTFIAEAEFINMAESYIGRDLKVRVRVKEDISVKEAKLFYRSSEGGERNELLLKLAEGEQNDGIYEALIKADALREGNLYIQASIKDYADNITNIEKTISILPGIELPWEFDFENNLDGFVIEGRWGLSSRGSSAEPPMADDKATYIGIDPGKAGFEKKIDSYLYLPPIDLSGTVEGQNISFTLDMYKSFTGISLAKIEASHGDDDWEEVHNVTIRPDITQRSWERNTYSLAKYAGDDRPLLIRFYFRGHDADEGAGWYLDNMHLDYGDSILPAKVRGLRADIDQRGLKLSFIKNEETDIFGYIIERKLEDGEFEKIAEFNDADADIDFINNGVDKTHYRVNYYDKTAAVGTNYVYRVRAVDISRNEGEWSDELRAETSIYNPSVAYDFEYTDGDFSSGVITGSINDWEYGIPTRPDNLNYLQTLVWDGMAKNKSKMWGTKINDTVSNLQDSYLVSPDIYVEENSYIYIDSFSTVPDVDSTRFFIEIKDSNEDEWFTLFTREEIQNQRTLHTWQTLSKKLSNYEDKTVNIRFRVNTENGVDFDYNLGWYIDNIYVSPKRTDFSNINGISTLSEVPKGLEDGEIYNDRADETDEKVGVYRSMDIDAESGVTNTITENTVPLAAKVTVLETGKYTYASEIDGRYYLPHSVNAQEKSYTVMVSAYGYESQKIEVDLSTESHLKRDFVLKPAKKAAFSGNIKDEEANALPDVSIMFLEDENIPLITSKANGDFLGNEIYTGDYTVRFYKYGYIPKEINISLSEGNNTIDDVVLEKITEDREETLDYGFLIEENNGDYQTTHFGDSKKGMAVRFIAPYEGSVLKDVDVFLVNNKVYGGSHIMLAVLGYDNEGRLRELAPFKEYKNLTPNEWNKIDFGEYNIQRDEPIYIASRYEKGLNDSFGIFYDVKADKRAKENSFIYDGAFTATTVLPAQGAYAVRTGWRYKEGAKENKDVEDSSGKDIGGGNIDDGVFIFDKETNTITGYNGSYQSLTIPAHIDGVEVKHIADRAFDGTGKDFDIKIRRLIISEGIEDIGEEAFKNNSIGEIILPESLHTIARGAFKYQWKTSMEDRTLKVNIPKKVTRIESNTFESAGNPIIIEDMKGVRAIEKNSFLYNKNVEITAPMLEEVDELAFGSNKNPDFSYAKIYTATDTKLKSKDGGYLINPGVVTLNQIDADDTERVIKIGLKYGKNNPKSYSRQYSPEEFYKIGDMVEVKPHDFRDEDILYTSIDEPKDVKVEKNIKLDFYYYALKPQLRLPVLDIDKELVGFSLPNADIAVNIDGKEETVRANEDGYFKLSVDNLSKDIVISFKINTKSAGEIRIKEYLGEKYIVEDGKLLRYLGNEKDLTIPNSVGSSKNIEEIADFAFYNKNISSVVLPDKVKTIGKGAFLDNAVESFSWNLTDINKSLLRTVKAYAFKNNRIGEVRLPELCHIIQTKAFENNQISSLLLGKYTGHIGDSAFENNQIRELIIPENIEEIGKSAFKNNLIERLEFIQRQVSSEHMEGITELESEVFAGNRLREVKLIPGIKYVAEDTFKNNADRRVLLKTDTLSIVAGEYVDVLRSDGTRLQIFTEDEKKENKGETQENPQEDNERKNNGSNGNNNIINNNSSRGSGSRKGGGGSLSSREQKEKLPKGYRFLNKDIVPVNVIEGDWIKKGNKWQFADKQKNIRRNEWVYIYLPNVDTRAGQKPYAWFRFDAEGYMQTGWFTDKEGNTYYLNTKPDATEGAMATSWVKIADKWYYFDTAKGKDNGKLWRKKNTPDGYYVGEDGAYIKK